MSKATSLNAIESSGNTNVSHEIDNVLAEIESSKHNQVPQQLPPQQPVQMPPMQGQQLPPQQYQQQPREMPPQYQQPQEMPPQYIQSQDPQYAMPNFVQNYESKSSGILDFLQSFLIMGDEFKYVAIIAGLFVAMNLSQTISFIGRYIPFTVNELGSSTLLGNVTRGLVLSIIFVLINKFI